MNFANGEPPQLAMPYSMRAQTEDSAEEIKRLQRCINDLVSVLALPAMWTGRDPSQIVHILLETLLGMLRLDFIYARLKDRGDETPLEMIRIIESGKSMPALQEICEVVKQWWGDEPYKWPPSIPHPRGGGDISIVPLPLGWQGEIGIIVAGTRRENFPQQTEKFVLSVAANQAAIALQQARLLSEQKQAARELNQTTQLSDSFAFLPFTVLTPSMSSEALPQARSVHIGMASGSVLES